MCSQFLLKSFIFIVIFTNFSVLSCRCCTLCLEILAIDTIFHYVPAFGQVTWVMSMHTFSLPFFFCVMWRNFHVLNTVVWRMSTGRLVVVVTVWACLFCYTFCVCKPVVLVCWSDTTIKRGKRLVLVCRQDSEPGAARAADCWVPSHLWQVSDKTEAEDHEHQCYTKPHTSTCCLRESLCK